MARLLGGDQECEFCEIDDFGAHAPRCPVSLERERDAALLRLDREYSRADAQQLRADELAAELSRASHRLDEVSKSLRRWVDNRRLDAFCYVGDSMVEQFERLIAICANGVEKHGRNSE